MKFDPFFLGLPNKFISYSIVTLLSYILIPIFAAASQIKSFLLIDQVAVFIFITPIVLAGSYYCIKDYSYVNNYYYVKLDILFTSALIFSLFGFLCLILNFRTDISNISIIGDSLSIAAFKSQFASATYSAFLLFSIYYCVDRDKRVKFIFLVSYFLLEGFLFLLAVNAISQVNAEPRDFLDSFIIVLASYLGVWTLVSFYVTLLQNKEKKLLSGQSET